MPDPKIKMKFIVSFLITLFMMLSSVLCFSPSNYASCRAITFTYSTSAIHGSESDQNDLNTAHESNTNSVAQSRRSCLSRIIASASIFATCYESIGWIENIDTNQDLNSSTKFKFFSAQSAIAYERDVGADGVRSADTYAQNLQARETNARLEASGFKLDTKEEETARLNEAFASFSYSSNSNTGKSNKTAVGKGYGSNNNNASSKSK